MDSGMNVKATLKKVKYTSKPINTRCTTTRIVDFMKANNLSERPLIIKDTAFGVFLDIPPFRTEKCLLESILSFWNPDREKFIVKGRELRSNYACPLELVDIVEDLDNLGQYAWAKAVHIDIMKALRRSSWNLERAGLLYEHVEIGQSGVGWPRIHKWRNMPCGRKTTYTRLFHELKSEEIHQKIDFIEEERVLLPEVEEDDDNAAPETHNVLMPMSSGFYSVEDLRKGLERVLHMPMPINAVSPSTSSPNMKRKREQREQKLVNKDMDKKVKPVPSKRTPDKVEKKKVGMAEAKYASSSSKRMTSPSPGKRIGSIERMVKIKRSNIPKQCEKSKENQGDVAKKGPKGD
ncbi:hypothetical protein QJS10_CPB13g01089 [Acorus calamus]|uniref:Uncharacterized protein n=1 Tax=Acorus calamus TaxID=4465 RepID=A0AAV9DJE9_ACOCL|nr:hypothetical protein QJS10_CPB13g01089 [Acorus calamus]